jgi:uncharacterized membrane protein/glycosyltransferase involved in cell wall biosynthesis
MSKSKMTMKAKARTKARARAQSLARMKAKAATRSTAKIEDPYKNLPFMSVVVSCYNGANSVGRTIESLLEQDYPRSKFEIIIVNDGSSDNTEEVIRSYPEVRYVGYPDNRGISGARNAGLEAAKGDIYVACDDDCLVRKDWLSQLAKGYAFDDPAGVCGYMVADGEAKGVFTKYLHATGSGWPPVVRSGKTTILRRLWNYARATFSKHTEDVAEYAEVEEFYGANGSFPVEELRAIGGWRTEMNWIEDRDISRRIREQFPTRHFYAMRKAEIIHDPDLSMRQYMLRPWKRGAANLKFHQQNHITPPLFPFPFLMALLVITAVVFAPLLIIPILLIMPQLLYMRWPLAAVADKKKYLILFPYLQLIEETMTIAGLSRARWRQIQATEKWFKHWLRPSVILSVVLTLVWAWHTVHTQTGIVREASSIVFLLLVPGYFTLRALIGYKDKLQTTKLVIYSTGLSLLVLMLLGIGTNWVLILLGNKHPLSVAALTYAVAGEALAAILLAAIRKPLHADKAPMSFRPILQAWPVILTSIVLPFLAVGGAITLNNGGSSWLALTTMGLIAGFALLMLWRTSSRSSQFFPVVLYSLCLSILLGTSMRGWNITGHDVTQEFQVFELTLRHSAWHMSYYQDAYNACLSITILPTIFQKLTGVTDQYVYKFIFQLFFALIAPVMYTTLRFFTTKRLAFLAVFVFMTFPAFLTDITMLNRQETALLCFALAVLAGLDTRLAARHRSILSIAFLAAMILSHYSTSYIAAATLMLMFGVSLATKVLAKVFRSKQRQVWPSVHIFSWPVITIAIVVLVTWGGFATQTSGNISRTLQSVVKGLPTLLQSAGKSDGSSRTGQTSSSDKLLQSYFATAADSRPFPAQDYYPPAITNKYPASAMKDTVSPLRQPLQAHGISPATVYKTFDKSRQLYGTLIEGLIGLGVSIVVLVRRWRNRMNGQYRAFILASLAVIAIQVVVPASFINYGLLRVIQQALLVLALPLVLACFWSLGLLRIPRTWRIRIIATGFVLLYLLMAGFLPALTGGYKPALPLSNNGFYYDAYYTHQAEISGDRWLAADTPKGSRVYSDEFARRRMITYAGIFSRPTLAPAAIPVDSYVFLSDGNITNDSVPLYYNGALIYHAVPYGFLNDTKNLVYSSQDIRIYK